jgi:hypothetical protein
VALGKLISRDPVRGVSVYLDIQPDGSFLFTEVQNVRGMQRRINEQSAESTGRRRPNTQRTTRQVAELPAIVVNRLIREGIWGDDKKMRQWLNDPDHRDFRTGGGRL